MNNKLKNVITRIGCGGLALLSTTSLSCKLKEDKDNNADTNNIALPTAEIINQDDKENATNELKDKSIDISYIPVIMYPERKTKGDIIREIDIYSSVVEKLQNDMSGPKTETGENKRMGITYMNPVPWHYKTIRYNDTLQYNHYIYCESYNGYSKYDRKYPFMVGYTHKKHELEKIVPNAFELTGEEKRAAFEKIYNQMLRYYQKLGYTRNMNIGNDIRYISVEEISDFHNEKIEANPHAGDILLKVRSTITLSDGTEMYLTDYCLGLKTKTGNNTIYVWSIYSPTREIQHMMEEYYENNITGIYDKYLSQTPIVYNQSGYTRKRTLVNK